MTGYGVVQGKIGSRRAVVETKSVNHKFCEVNLRLSPRYLPLEGRIVEFTKSYFSRGRIDVLIRDEPHPSDPGIAKIDVAKLKAYYQSIQKAARALKLKNSVDLNTLLSLPDVIATQEETDLEKTWGQLKPLLKTSFAALEKMRSKEGASLDKFFKEQLSILEGEIAWITKRVPDQIEHHRKNLLERIGKMTDGVEADPQRLAQEIAYFVDRSDISEELHRLSHHVKHFLNILQDSDVIGRKLDFLLQEMNREVNTLSAKAQSAEISEHVVECKHVVEKMREQAQNVE
jgi:uncharacterized protein (TIGR00255 family)